jgi:hypothetical protein
MNTFFALDEFTDILDPRSVRDLCSITMDAISDPDRPRPKTEHVIGEIARQWVLNHHF